MTSVLHGSLPDSFTEDRGSLVSEGCCPRWPCSRHGSLPSQSSHSHPIAMPLLPRGHKQASEGNLGTSDSVHDCFTASWLFTWNRQVMPSFLLGPVVL